jgi:predicted metal-dependent enzyme (double-stranded beta helix superfamily)
LSTALDDFVRACRRARREMGAAWPQAAAEAMRGLLRDKGLAQALREAISASPEKGIAIFANEPDLTIYAISGQGGLRSAPHDHATTAVVGLVEGIEQYKVYRRDGRRCVETETVQVRAGQVAVMDEDLVHAMWCDSDQSGLSLHVYGNSHFDAAGRRQWDPATLEEEPFDVGRQRAWTRELTRAARALA